MRDAGWIVSGNHNDVKVRKRAFGVLTTAHRTWTTWVHVGHQRNQLCSGGSQDEFSSLRRAASRLQTLSRVTVVKGRRGPKVGAPVIRQEPSRRGRLGLQQGMKVWTKQLQLQASVQESRFRRSVTIPAAARMKQRMGWIHPAKHCAVLPKIPHLEPLPKTSRRCRCSTALTLHQKSRERQWPLTSATSLSKRQWKPDKPSLGRPFC